MRIDFLNEDQNSSGSNQIPVNSRSEIFSNRGLVGMGLMGSSKTINF